MSFVSSVVGLFSGSQTASTTQAPATPSHATDGALAIAVPLIARFEGCRLVAYHGAADRIGLWTIGYGDTVIDGQPVREGQTITQEHATELLAKRVSTDLAAVRAMVEVKLCDNEAAALTSLAYNIGLYALQTSTLIRKLSAGDRAGAADQFLVWDRSDSREVPGLEDRREAERALFLSV